MTDAEPTHMSAKETALMVVEQQLERGSTPVTIERKHDGVQEFFVVDAEHPKGSVSTGCYAGPATE